ncbi:MAG TPA: VWA domain-containing protein [Nitrospinaceae bacterium]|nr:VWA domain-containing protein [Nitrospinaceae bacterium]
MTFFRFEDPWLLLILLSLPILILRERTIASVINYSSLASLKAVSQHHSKIKAMAPIILRFIAITLFIIAFARPQEGHKRTEILSQGVDIVLAIDTSGSMQALDFKKNETQVTRLSVVKDVVAEFVKNREMDRIGMVVFGANAFTQCPLTLDQNILLSFLDKLKIGMAGDATAIGSAIGISARRLKDLKSKSKVIILLTDGRNNSGAISPLQAAEIAKSLGIKVYTIGVGKRGKAPFLVDSIFGKRLIYQNVDIDEEVLNKISKMTDAKYFRATDLKSLKDIYKQIDLLEKSEVKSIDHSEHKELFHYFLIPGLILLLTEIVFSNSFLRRLP